MTRVADQPIRSSRTWPSFMLTSVLSSAHSIAGSQSVTSHPALLDPHVGPILTSSSILPHLPHPPIDHAPSHSHTRTKLSLLRDPPAPLSGLAASLSRGRRTMPGSRQAAAYAPWRPARASAGGSASRVCDDQRWANVQRPRVSLQPSENVARLTLSLARAFKRAGWKVIGVEERG